MKILYKDASVTLHNFIQTCKQEGYLQGKYCYCGRLDPMASGKMLFLENEECSDMVQYLQCDKEYEIEIGLGISTDTDDILGLIDDVNFDRYGLFDSSTLLQSAIIKVAARTTQQYHAFSAFQVKQGDKRVNLCELSKENKLDKTLIPSKACNVYSITNCNKKIADLHYYIDVIIKKIERLDDSNHYYRKREIITQWKEFLSTIPHGIDLKMFSYKYKIKVSSGFYIRQFIHDLKKECNFPLLVLGIHRTNIFKDGVAL